MRLWTLHPRHLDPAGLVALWREALLAQAVLLGKTKGYRHHPQLKRFQALPDPAAGVAAYLAVVQAEATTRGYDFDASKIARKRFSGKIPETRGQLEFEWEHLRKKLVKRNPEWHKAHHAGTKPSVHPMFRMVSGGVREWEKA
jgi:hypothetical protein